MKNVIQKGKPTPDKRQVRRVRKEKWESEIMHEIYIRKT
jgi:hypothetical protein